MFVVSCRCLVDGSVHAWYPDGHMPGLKYLPEAHPSGQHSLPPGPSQPTSRFGYAPSYSILVRRSVKHEGSGVKVVVKGPVLECQVSRGTSVVVDSAKVVGRAKNRSHDATDNRNDAVIAAVIDDIQQVSMGQ